MHVLAATVLVAPVMAVKTRQAHVTGRGLLMLSACKRLRNEKMLAGTSVLPLCQVAGSFSGIGARKWDATAAMGQTEKSDRPPSRSVPPRTGHRRKAACRRLRLRVRLTNSIRTVVGAKDSRTRAAA
jgi:hypothetical protein